MQLVFRYLFLAQSYVDLALTDFNYILLVIATVPTLYDLIVNGELEGQNLNNGDVIIFASVGAGMNINAIVYQM